MKGDEGGKREMENKHRDEKEGNVFKEEEVEVRNERRRPGERKKTGRGEGAQRKKNGRT